VKKSKAFKNTMAFAGLLKRASVIASKVYKALPEHWKEFWMYRSFVGEAMGMLKVGKTDEEALKVLWERYAAEFGEGYREEEGFVHEGVVREDTDHGGVHEDEGNTDYDGDDMNDTYCPVLFRVHLPVSIEKMPVKRRRYRRTTG
jgi:hypothetical protein